MRIRIPNFIGRKLYLKVRRWEIRKQLTVRPVIRIEMSFYYNYGKVPYTGSKYYIAIGGRKKMRNKRRTPQPIRRTEDITPISEMITSTVIFTCVMGAIFLILMYGGL